MAVNAKLLAEWLIVDEALFLTVYDDATEKPLRPGMTLQGHPTIGIGRALDVHGITHEEAVYLVTNDIERVVLELHQALPWFDSLDEVRSTVLADMAFNMGTAGLLSFHDTLTFIKVGEYAQAADAMLSSKWCQQVGSRAKRLADRMRSGLA